jgi:PTH1 family peptidyl-tRNA hydrolase
MSLFLLVGLGNPGPQYLWTRHNAGFMVLDRFAARHGVAVSRKNFGGLTAETSLEGTRLVLLKPQTFMNLSGRSVAAAARFHKVPAERIVVIHDDLDLPYGSVRLKEGGGHGGHNGLRSIVQEMGDSAFLRLRVGIDRSPHPDVAGYVLQSFSPTEMEGLADILDGAVEALETLLSGGVGKAMSLFNNRSFIQR